MQKPIWEYAQEVRRRIRFRDGDWENGYDEACERIVSELEELSRQLKEGEDVNKV